MTDVVTAYGKAEKAALPGVVIFHLLFVFWEISRNIVKE